jgi:integrase
MSECVTVGNPFIAKGRSHYYVKITLTNPTTGKQRILKKSINVKIESDQALSKAHRARLALLSEYETHHDPAAPLKLKDFAEQYIKEREAENLTVSSIRGITKAFSDLLRCIGKNRLLTKVVASDLRAFLFIHQKSPSMALVTYRYLHAAFDRAVRDEKLTMNPFNQIDKKLLRKRFKPRPRGILSSKEVIKKYENLPKDKFCDRTYANYFLLLYGTAFRRGEGCFLEEKHADFKDKTIRMESSEKHTLKTEASTADIPMTQHATIALKDQIKSKSTHPIEEVRKSTYIFCNFVGRHYYPSTLRKQVLMRVKKVCKELGIDSSGVDLHSMRHSLIQHLIDSGAEPVTVSKFARHANLSTTLSAYHKMKDTKTDFKAIMKVTKEMPRPKRSFLSL